MFSLLVSNPQVRLGSLTNTQGSPHSRLAILASQNSGMHVLICNPVLAEVMMNPQSNLSFTAFVGIDWADKKHDFCMQAAGSAQRVFGTLEHSPEVIEQWAYSLRDRFGGPIAICLELTKGPLVYALQRYEFLVLFPVHPSTLAKYREAFVPSHAKDDPTDAEMALDLLLRHPDKLQPLKLQSVAMRTLATLVEERRGLVDNVVSITNSLSNQLKQYYPQVLDWFEHRDTLIFCDFLSRWPTLRHVKRARRSTLETFSTSIMSDVHTSSRSVSMASGMRLHSRRMRPLSVHARWLCRLWSNSSVPCCRPSIASMPRSMPLPRACPTTICSQRCQVLATSRPPGCWSPLAKIEIVMQMPHRFSAIQELPR
jgi:hypothetical protein